MTEEGGVTPPMIINMMQMMQMMQQQRRAPQTPAQRQAKCRALKRGEQIYAQQLPENWTELPEYADLRARLSAQGKPAAALPAPARKALPSATTAATTAAASGTAIQKAFSPEAASANLSLALGDADGAGVGGGVGGGEALRLTLPPAVEDRLRSLLDRHKSGKHLTAAERAEAQGLLDIAEYFVVQRLRNRLAA